MTTLLTRLTAATGPDREQPLLHYSVTPPTVIRSVKQTRSHSKPLGFWVSVGDGEGSWKDWCESEQWGLERLVNPIEVTLAESAKILWLTNNSEIMDFTREYDDITAAPGRGHAGGLDWTGCYINWPKVAENFDGIIIAPYLSDCRHDLSWYYTWDCASGCIWDARAVADLSPTPPTDPAAR